MPGIEELHFEVILDKDKFQRDVEAIQKVAANLNNTLTQSLNLTKSVGSGISGMVAPQTQYTQAVEKTNTALTGTSNLMRTISQLTGVAFGVVGLRRFTAELIQTAGAFEVQKAALSSMLQDAEKAGEIFDTLRQKALESPYTFQDLTKFAKQLIAFNIPADQLVETERRLADVAAGLGVDMGRIILAYGQVKAAGALKGQELRQFTEAGVPILEQLAKQIEEVEGRTVSLSEVFNRVTKKQIPFEMVEEAFKRMTDEGGKFYNMQEVLVETLSGKISKLRDVWQQALYDLGNANSGFLKGSVDAVTALVQNLDRLGKMIPTIISSLGAFKLAQIALEVGTNSFALANHKVLDAFKQIGAWIAKNPYAIIAAAIAAVTVKVVQLIQETNRLNNRVNEAIRSTGEDVAKELEKLEVLDTKLKLAKKGTEEWAAAKKQIVDNYGSYIRGLDAEIDRVGTLATAYEQLKAAAEESVRVRRFLDFKKQEEDMFDQLNEKSLEELSKHLYDKYSPAQAYTIMTAVRDAMKKYGTPDDVWNWGNGDIANIIGYDRNSKAYNKTAALIGTALANNRGGRTRMLEELRELVDAFGLKGTVYDPDFIGPLPSPGKSGGVVQNKWGNDWKPLGGEKNKANEFEWVDKMMAEVDKELAAIFKENTDTIDKQLDERFAAMNRWDAFIDKLKHTQGVKEGEGAAFKLSGYLLDFKNEDYKNLDEYRDHLADLKAQFDEDSAAFKSGKEKLDDWKKSVDESAKNKLKEKIRGLADDLMKEGLIGYDLTNFSDKSLEQLNELKRVIDSLELPDEVRALLEKYPELLKALNVEFEKLKQGKIDKTIDPERWKKVSNQIKYISKQFLSIANSLGEYASAAGNTKLSNAAEAVSRIAQNISSAVEGYKAFGGWWGAVIGGVSDIINQVIGASSKAEEEARKLANAVIDAKANIDKTLFDNSLKEGVDTIFGENAVRKIKNAVAGLGEAEKKMEGLEEIRSRWYSAWYNTVLNQEGFSERFADWRKQWEEGGIEDTFFFTDTKARKTARSLAEIAKDLNLDLYDSYKNLNPELLKQIQSLYGELNAGAEEWLKNAITYSEEYAAAMKGLEDMMESLFGNIASDAADKIVDSWIAAGDAALDYVDILDDVARAYSKMLVQSMIMETFLDPITADLKKAFYENRYEDAMAMIATAMDGISNSAPMFEQILSAFDPYFNRGDSANSLGGGIKSITEETASLLASYINAMRADLSVVRGLQERGWTDVSILASSVPTLNDYLQQIAATNFDIAQSNQSILSELRSVIGAPGTSGSVMRVEMA